MSVPDRDGVWCRIWLGGDGHRKGRAMVVRGVGTDDARVIDLRKGCTRPLSWFASRPGWWEWVRTEDGAAAPRGEVGL